MAPRSTYVTATASTTHGLALRNRRRRPGLRIGITDLHLEFVPLACESFDIVSATPHSAPPNQWSLPCTTRPYETIAESLREQILSGALPPGAQLPTVAQLAVAHTVAVG